MREKNNVEVDVQRSKLYQMCQMTGIINQKLRLILVVSVLSLLFSFNSCMRMQSMMRNSGNGGNFIAFTGDKALLSVTKSYSKIGVIAYSGITNPMPDIPTLRTIVESAMITSGFNVVRNDVYDLLTSTNYQLLGFVALNANASPTKTLTSTWFGLQKELLQDTGATDILVISMLDEYKYNVSLIDVRTKSVIISFAVNADSQEGWDTFLKPLNNKPWIDYNSSYEGQYYVWGQLANKIVSLLEGRR